jgi:AAA15 family ATPase/GTPase
MIQSLTIKNYRCFSSFKLEKLGRINLLVGTNNCGKTSLLEAINILCDSEYLEALRESMLERGEFFTNDDIFNNTTVKKLNLEISHLFYQHHFIKDNPIIIQSREGENRIDEIHLVIEDTDKYKDDLNIKYRLALSIQKTSLVNGVYKGDTQIFPLSSKKSLDAEFFVTSSQQEIKQEELAINKPLEFILSSTFDFKEMLNLFDKIVLTPEEEIVYEALQCIDPTIQRIAPIATEKIFEQTQLRGGFVIRLMNVDERVSIGSLGDGVWRMLGIVLALVNVKNGILLVDEIDTGLHYSVMYDMWKLILKTAKKLNIQVFATTHNSDCWKSLAEVAEKEEFEEDEVTIHRIEKGATSSIMFDKKQMMIAAERDIEVR